MRTIIFTVTNDLNYDQRMQRICSSLAMEGYKVKLVGRRVSGSIPLVAGNFSQKRLRCFFSKGFLFYAEYNIRLFIYLLFSKLDIICAVDLDTVLPCYFVSALRKKKRVCDAHELFCEMKEIASRPHIYRVWKNIEKFALPRFSRGYTVNHLLAREFERMYGLKYKVIRSMPLLTDWQEIPKEKFILYQGAVNEGRCFEHLIPAMKKLDARLIICGNGNFMQQAKDLSRRFEVEAKIDFLGMISPAELLKLTRRAYIGITLFDKAGLSNYYSLANRFFDYIHGYTPQLCVDYPLYRELNNLYPVAVLIEEPDTISIEKALADMLKDRESWHQMHRACKTAAQELNWQKESKALINFYNDLIG